MRFYYRDNSFSSISGNSKKGFTVHNPVPVSTLFTNGSPVYQYDLDWIYCYTDTLVRTEWYTWLAIAGGTSHGSCSFVALKNKGTGQFQWLLLSDSLNNPLDIWKEGIFIFLKTDLHYSNGVMFKIPIEYPASIYLVPQ